MSKPRFGCLIIGLIVVLVVSLFINLALVAGRANLKGGLISEVPKFEESVLVPGGSDKIVLLQLHGIISGSLAGTLGETMVEDLKMALQQATEDDAVKAIVLSIDSPGGEVTASDAIYHAVVEARKKKPVVVQMGSLAASGGYYIACAGSYVMAHETTLTGSIGVIIQTLKYQDLFGKIGLQAVVFKSGAFKDILSGTRDMTPEEQALIQGLVMGMYDKFVGIVAKERKIPEATLRDGIADGRIFSGGEAEKLKLVDGLGYIEDAYAKARELGGASDAQVVRYEAPFSLGKLARVFSQSKLDSKVDLNVTSDLLPKLETGRIYLLPGYFAP